MIIRPLRGGGMKQVYLAEDLRLARRRCALAEMIDSFSDPAARRSAIIAFQGEAAMLAALEDDHIPEVFDNFSEQNHHYLAMEYVDGETLEQGLAASGGRLPEGQVIAISSELLKALLYIHNLTPPVIFRDLKASNVMINRRGQVKLIDFGIARYFQPAKTATMIGTQGYAPPEQYKGKAEPRSDLYALGALMHYLLSGRDPSLEPPFSFPRLDQLVPGCSPSLSELVNNSLAYDLAARVPTAMEFQRRLVEVQNSSFAANATTQQVRPDSQKKALNVPAGSRVPWKSALTLICLLLVGHQLAVYFQGTSEDVPSRPTGPPPEARLSTSEEPATSATAAVIRLTPPFAVKTREAPIIGAKALASVKKHSRLVVPAPRLVVVKPTPRLASLSKADGTGFAKRDVALPPKNYFTIGSSKDQVSAIQGTPTSVLSFGYGETWRYNFSSVDFAPNGTVKGYSDISHNLRVHLTSSVGSTSGDYFTIDSDKNKVLAIQGTPTGVMSFGYGETWRYNYSSVDFAPDGRVKGYSDISHNLRVHLAPSVGSTSGDYFTIGSDKNEVLAVQGTPTGVMSFGYGETWRYNYSSVDFASDGTVKGYSNISHNLRIRGSMK
jgi:serine/threonine protein kinase